MNIKQHSNRRVYFMVICLLGIGWASQKAMATVYTVSNIGGAQYADINSAVVASAIGDTIYINGSSTSYTAPTTRKDDLTFVGAGFNPQKQNPLLTNIIGGFFNVGNNNKIMAMAISSYIHYLDGTNSLSIERCLLSNSLNSSGALLCNNVVVRDCICTSILLNGNKITNCLIANTLFYKNISYGFFSSMNAASNTILDHCVFLNTTGAPQNVIENHLSGSNFSFSNCIFFNSLPLFNSNMTYVHNFSAYSALNNYGTGNIVSTVWPFVAPQNSTNGPFQKEWDFTINTASVARNAATNGSDLGIYGGATPYHYDGAASIPQMDSMSVIGTQFTSGGTMPIKFQASIKD